jgi:hypothetical protein
MRAARVERREVMRTLLVTIALVVMFPGIGESADFLINNGSAPPDPANVIDYDTSPDSVYVRNVGCGVSDPNGPCSAPGDPTTVGVVDFGYVPHLHVLDSSATIMTGGNVTTMIAWNNSSVMVDGASCFLLALIAHDSSTVTINDAQEIEDFLEVFDSATLTMNGGVVFTQLIAHDSSTVTVNDGGIIALWSGDFSTVSLSGGLIFYDAYAYGLSMMVLNGGTVQGKVRVEGSGIVTMNGGTVEGELWALESGVIEIVGLNFEVDAVPVPYGDLTATTGTLTGVLALGDPLANTFYQGGATCGAETCTGTIRLIEAPDADGDLVPDDADNCPTIWNESQADQDADAVGNACDNCVEDYNPRAAYPSYRTTSGGQLDDDYDGYGNLCDCEFALVAICGALDTLLYKTAINKPVWASNCGIPATNSCDRFDLDGMSPVINALDTIRYKQLLNQPVGPKCPICPLECVGDACP